MERLRAAIYRGALASALLLAGCGDHSVSGSYVLNTEDSATLLQITETPDHRFTGTTRNVSLNKDGTLAASTANVAGSVDGTSITLTVQALPFLGGETFSGTVTGTGIDLTVSHGTRASTVAHFVKGKPADFDAAVRQFNKASSR